MRFSPAFRLIAALSVAALAFSATNNSLKPGKAELKSAGPLAFGPDGVLFVGDSVGATIFALDTADTQAAPSGKSIEVKAINQKIAGLLGTTPDQILVQSVAVNPISK